VRLSGARIEHASVDALVPAFATIASAETIERGAVLRAIGSALDQAPQALPDFDADVGLAAGRLSLTPTDASIGATTVRIGGAFDLRNGAIDLRETVCPAMPKNWDGAQPVLDIVWKGDARSPSRTIEADALLAALAENAVARETARNESLEADIRERAFFNRRLKSDRRLDAERRAAAEARRAAEQARLEQARRERAQREQAQRERIERELRAQKANEAAEAPRRPPERAPPQIAPIENRPAATPRAATSPPRGAVSDPSSWGRY
jgi:flagellar biosynthesis GTPase FlhF